MPALVCIIAGQRSGSTIFRDSLCRSYGYVDYGEILHNRELKNPYNFFGYFQESGAEIERLIWRDELRSLLERYLDWLQEGSSGRGGVIDVKFNAWGHLPAVWSYPQQEPLLLEILKARSCKILLLRRRDRVAQAVSHEICNLTGLWTPVERDRAVEPVEIDPELICRRVVETLKAERTFSRFLEGYEHSRTVFYEDIFDRGDIACTAAQADVISKLLKRRPWVKPQWNSGLLDKRKVVKNYAAIEERVEKEFNC